MKMNHVRILITMLFLNILSVANAQPLDSSPVYFNGGYVTPNSTYVIELTKAQLIGGRHYKITCDIHNPLYNKPYPVVMRMTTHQYAGRATITLNGKPLAFDQGTMNHEINKYLISDVSLAEGNINDVLQMKFENFDTSDSVTIENCMASYVTN